MKTLILIPGALGHASQFNPLMNELASALVHATAIDLPGHGTDPYASDADTVPKMAKAFLMKLDEHGIHGPVNIFGHSLGGYLGLYLCTHYPERVARLFTLGTKWLWNPEVSQKECSMLQPDVMEQKIPAYVDQLKQIHTNDWKKLVQAVSALMFDLGQHNYFEINKLQNTHHPVRIALGDRDRMVTVEETVSQYRSLPNAQFQVYPNTPHPYEKSEVKRLAADIHHFFS